MWISSRLTSRLKRPTHVFPDEKKVSISLHANMVVDTGVTELTAKLKTHLRRDRTGSPSGFCVSKPGSSRTRLLNQFRPQAASPTPAAFSASQSQMSWLLSRPQKLLLPSNMRTTIRPSLIRPRSNQSRRRGTAAGSQAGT